MNKRPLWFDACIIAVVFATVLLGASMHLGVVATLLNLIAIGCFVAPVVMAVKEGTVGGG